MAIMGGQPEDPISVTAEEMEQAGHWMEANLCGDQRSPVPFSFAYAGRQSAGLLEEWERKQSSRTLDDQRTEHAVTWTEPSMGLSVRCVAIEYHDFPVVEWTVHFKNQGAADTPILQDAQALDMHLERHPEGEFVLHHYKGDFCTPDGYEPYRTPLPPGASLAFAPVGGRGTNFAFPYYNLEMPGGGLILAVGWPGQWTARFARDTATGLNIRTGQELTHLKLHPGEEMRTPLLVLLFWKGNDPIRAQNLWRRWMIAHNMPRPAAKLPSAMQPGSSSWQFDEMQNANEENQKFFIDRYQEKGIALTHWWMDAGWYPFNAGWWNTGSWEVDAKRFPRGLRAVADHAHARGLNVIVWFEPEKVTPRTWLYEQHPEWLLGNRGKQKLLYLGNPAAREWLTNHVDRMVTEQGIDVYRQDFNFEPLPYWRENDEEDRQGIAENHHITGYLAYWDELRRRHPDILIDSCASGGRRNDLETLRRAVPLHKTDYNYADLPVKQAFHHSLALWIPFFGAMISPIEGVDPYVFRSAMCLCTVLEFDVRREDLDYALLRELTAQWQRVAPFFYGDYYPLTPYSREEYVWIAWQFDRPDLASGVLQAFRRAESPYESARFKLRGLDPEASYRVINLDEEGAAVMSGRELTEAGLLMTMKQQPQAVIIVYERVQCAP